MIFDSHMHVGSFESMFGVSLDRDGLAALMEEHEIGNGVVFHPDNAYVALPWSIEELVVKFPEAKVILGHTGHGNVVYINGAIEVVELEKVRPSGLLPEAVERVLSKNGRALFFGDESADAPG